jgi:hypothetical protein
LLLHNCIKYIYFGWCFSFEVAFYLFVRLTFFIESFKTDMGKTGSLSQICSRSVEPCTWDIELKILGDVWD